MPDRIGPGIQPIMQPAARPQKSLFRPRALEHFRSAETRVVLPRFARTQAGWVIWLLCLVLLAGVAVITFARLPQYARGSAVMLNGVNGQSPQVAVFVPASQAHRPMQRGTPVQLQFKFVSQPLRATVANVQGDVYSAERARAEFGANALAGLAFDEPMQVAILELDPHTWPGSVRAIDVAGIVGEASVLTGERRLISLLTGVSGLE